MIMKLEPNKPYTIALKYPTGKLVPGTWGDQLRWVLSNGDLLYTPLLVGPQIEDLGVRPGQPFMLTKHQNGRTFNWIAAAFVKNSDNIRPICNGSTPQRAATPVPHETKIAPKTAIATILDQSEALDGIPTSIPPTRLEDALKTAVAAAAAAEQYGKSIGYAVRFAPADIKSLGISVYIGQQGGRYAA
jgi:hypothetical protein